MDLRIVAFITVSTLTHGAAVLWLDTTSPAPQLALGGEARALRVALLPPARITESRIPEVQSVQTSPPASAGTQPPQMTKPDSHTAEAKRLTTGHNARTLQHANRKSHTQLAETNPDTTRDTPPEPTLVTEPLALNNNTATPPHSSTKNISRHISAALKNRLARHFEYPWLARQRGWQGQVLLSLHVASNGDLSDWKVVQTSGYRTLDQSALKAAQRIEHLPQAEHWLNGASLEVHLPVQYKLLDS
ncbi:MAG TPA: energy transducer TonB [Gammaproteobacteria bacterium]|nr:energy transducer TonB [Gammaproteobacteria bacterium]